MTSHHTNTPDAAAAQTVTPNEYGGHDHRTTNGMVRTTNNDGQLSIHVFDHRGTSVHDATFDGASTFNGIHDAALQAALDLIS